MGLEKFRYEKDILKNDYLNIDVVMNDIKKYEDGKPCRHPGCLHHATHPCECCGRICGVAVRQKIDTE